MSKKEEKAQLKESQSLLEFYKLHKDTIASCTLGAFCITLDRPTTRNLREMLVIQVVPNPASTRPETAFRVTDAKIMSLDSPETIEHFGQSQCEHFRKYLVEVAKMNERVGNIGGFMVVLETNSIKYYEPVSFKRPPVLLPSSNPDDIPLRLTWRQSLIRTLNSVMPCSFDASGNLVIMLGGGHVLLVVVKTQIPETGNNKKMETKGRDYRFLQTTSSSYERGTAKLIFRGGHILLCLTAFATGEGKMS
ncbi:hypothetical protein JR316_0010585 [Psilocybe cubensis]|uniref:Uncharacterized protein n=1 Tax=Psilocybe cubensis TaxID=181762 RepID=A0ACB8GM94_PSICU|nr:hypothetical protein JR316_0010585 [Psilocybe cubensis]KAH9476671.1 hypothetical protein JR316_0010585 [Psilocybe cubensis]